jgi:hypothetical protein
MRLHDLPQGGSHKFPVAALLTLSALPIHVVYPVFDAYHLTHHDSIHCPQISFPQGCWGQHTTFIFHPQVKTFPPALHSCPPPPLWQGYGPVACKATPVTQATLTPLIFVTRKDPSGKPSQATLVIATVVPRCTMRIQDPMSKGSGSSGNGH